MGKNEKPGLNAFERNVTSQCGEDGVIEKVLEIIGESDPWCVEFGAWNGKHLSNTWNLITSRGYNAVLIEGDGERFGDLQKFAAANPKVLPRNVFVGWDGPNRLDGILAGTAIPKNFDVLSIDIDGNDYHVWEALRDYRPKLVVIEFNPTIPSCVEFVQERNPKVNHGCSVLSLNKLAQAKGYELVACTSWNAFFVDRKYFERFGIKDNSVEALRHDLSTVTYIFNGFDGTVLMAGAKKVHWVRVPYRLKKMQMLPGFLRGYPQSKLQQFLSYHLLKARK